MIPKNLSLFRSFIIWRMDFISCLNSRYYYVVMYYIVSLDLFKKKKKIKYAIVMNIIM